MSHAQKRVETGRSQLREVRRAELLERAGEGLAVARDLDAVSVGGALAAAGVGEAEHVERPAGDRQAERERGQRRERARPVVRERVGQDAQQRGRERERERRRDGAERASCARGRRRADGRARARAPRASRHGAPGRARRSPTSVSKSMMRRVGPKPATNALAAEVLAPASSTRTDSTRTPAARASPSRSLASGPGASGCERRKSGRITTGASSASSSPTATAPAPRPATSRRGHVRCAQISSATAGAPSASADREPLARSASQPGSDWRESPASRERRCPQSAIGRPVSSKAAPTAST